MWYIFIFCAFSGNSSNDKRYRTEILVGYVLPLIFSIMTGLVEAFGSRCSSITPKFAEESCFFSCKYHQFMGVTSIFESPHKEITDVINYCQSWKLLKLKVAKIINCQNYT